MLKIYNLCFLVFISMLCKAQTSYDKYSIEHIHLKLEMYPPNSNYIEGSATLDIKIKNNPIQYISLDLLKLYIDSIIVENNGSTINVSYTYNDTLILAQLDRFYSPNETVKLTVYYKGRPVTDASGWGGFYNSPPYIYNLGVGFDANPHSYGRVWFPCLDDFKTKSTYSFEITVDSGYVAVPNGLRKSITYKDKKANFLYELNQPIPSYLACIAIAPYTFYTSSYNGIPIEIATMPSDTSKTRLLFLNLQECMKGFEESYGAYPFEKIGYSLVPFTGGAMEHATNIALPKSSLSGTKSDETLWAHELSHHWWGDNITCSTPEDMWLNEGWASFSEALYTEKIYGKDAYKKYVSDNHLYVLQFAHKRDSGYRALTNMPHQFVYGRTIYNKGADMVHSMRGVFGDSDFFAITKKFQNDYKFKSVSTTDLQNTSKQIVKDTNVVNDFFEHWINNPGFTHFEIVSRITEQKNGYFETKLVVKQRTQGTVYQYQYVPIEISFFKNIIEYKSKSYIMNGYETVVSFQSDYNPVFIAIDFNEKISDAITDDYTLVTNKTELVSMTHGKMSLYVNNNDDSSFIRVEHHWVGPEGKVTEKGLYYHPYRYWTVDGIWKPTFNADARIFYNGSLSIIDGCLDDKLITITEDSLVLLYRENSQKDWSIYNDCIKTMQNVNDKKGNIMIKNLQKGQYCLGMYDQKLSVAPKLDVKRNHFALYPNPSKGYINIEFDSLQVRKKVRIYTIDGKEIYSNEVPENIYNLNINIKHKGICLIEIIENNIVQTQKIIIE